MTVENRQRVVPLEGGRNFRDLGGYQTSDGRRVKWGKLFRSGSMIKLTQADWDSLVARGVCTVCDLRGTEERTHEPFAWSDSPNLAYFARDYGSSFGELRKVMAENLPDGSAARAAMMSGYRELPFTQAPAYRQVFAHLKANEVPLIVNCSAGKDRAGTGAALMLSALGVPRETVVEDFVLTNEVGNLRQALLTKSEHPGSLSKQPIEVTEAILIADPAYINAALDSVADRHGSMEAFLRDVLEVSDEDLQNIRQNLLE